MALRPARRHIPKLSVPQVLEIRDLYFRENYSLSELAYNYDVSKGLIQKAVHGIGKFYSSIEDDIPEGLKKDHLPSKEYLAKHRKYWQARQDGYTHEDALFRSGIPERYTK